MEDSILSLDTFLAIKKIDRENGININMQSYSLGSLYKRFIGEELVNAHTAEGDCLALLKIAIALNHQFMNEADRTAQSINDYTYTDRNKKTKFVSMFPNFGF